MNSQAFKLWCHAGCSLAASSSYQRKPLVMGVLNVTPDSFSDAGCFFNSDDAYDRAQEMIEQGADMIDIGGMSSRPGSHPVSTDEELSRVLPVIERIRSMSDVCLSIDTDNAVVMQAAIRAGADVINDIRALRGRDSVSVAAQLAVPVCLMHMQGDPLSMQDSPDYAVDVIDDINHFFHQRILACQQAGVLREHLILDPGFGFGKSVSHNLLILKRIAAFHQHQLPLLLGVSRKSTLGVVLHKTVLERLPGALAATVFAALEGVTIMRTHDVNETCLALQMLDAIVQAPLFSVHNH